MTAGELLQSRFPKQVEFDQPLKRFTSLKVGGAAQVIFYPEEKNQVLEAINLCRQIGAPYRLLGGGTNLLVSDAGYAGVVIFTAKNLVSYRVEAIPDTDAQVLLYGEAGVRVPGLINFCTEQGLSGLEFAAGIPGTFGGILWMNAGTKAGETQQIFHSMEVVNDAGSLQTLIADQVHFSYRSCGLPANTAILSGRIWLKVARNALEKRRIAETVNRVKSFRYNQPLQWPNCGSVFRNPEGDYAGRLIETCNLKGLRVGGAMISEQHANFIINTGEATAKDVSDLIEMVQQRVLQQCGIMLQTEVERLP